ncbi:MAG TPA: hypothetical protein VMD03_06705 [Steroidobacteraceae bacterium]|nr:hypothetical protein [Steroidobacteraceae bacterium]
MKPALQSRLDTPSLQLFLRIQNAALEPEIIGATLQLEPQHALAGRARESAAGTPAAIGTRYWICELPVPTWRTLSEEHEDRAAHAHALSPFTREDVAKYRDATSHDWIVLGWLKKLSAHEELLRSIVADGGSVALLVSSLRAGSPVQLRRSLAELARLDIELELL